MSNNAKWKVNKREKTTEQQKKNSAHNEKCKRNKRGRNDVIIVLKNSKPYGWYFHECVPISTESVHFVAVSFIHTVKWSVRKKWMRWWNCCAMESSRSFCWCVDYQSFYINKVSEWCTFLTNLIASESNWIFFTHATIGCIHATIPIDFCTLIIFIQ